jgi:hypothetical protein
MIEAGVSDPEMKGSGPQRFVIYRVRGQDRNG